MDVSQFVSSARRQRRSVKVYARPDVIADLDRINQELAVAKAANDIDVIAELEAAWQAAADTFHASGLRVVIEARNQDEINAVKVKAKAEGCDEEEESAMILADSIIEPEMTKENIIELRRTGGDAAVEILMQAWTAACFNPPPLAPEPDDG